jgi:hypothetical protein
LYVEVLPVGADVSTSLTSCPIELQRVDGPDYTIAILTMTKEPWIACQDKLKPQAQEKLMASLGDQNLEPYFAR